MQPAEFRMPPTPQPDSNAIPNQSSNEFTRYTAFDAEIYWPAANRISYQSALNK